MGKDAVAGEIVDGAACVADLADLADLDQDVIANLELRAQGECEQVDSLGGEVLSKIALVHIESARLRRLDRFCGQKRDLAVPMPGMRIGGESKLLDDGIVPIGDGRLARALVRRCIDRDDAAGSGVGIGGGAQRGGRLRALGKLAPRGVNDGVVGRVVLGHACTFRRGWQHVESYNKGGFIA